MSSESGYFFALPGDAVFQCHGVSPCVTNPLELCCRLSYTTVGAMNFTVSMHYRHFGHRRTPPYWTIGDWQPSAGVTSLHCNLADGLPSDTDDPDRWRLTLKMIPESSPLITLKDCSAPVHYYGTDLFGGLPADLPTDHGCHHPTKWCVWAIHTPNVLQCHQEPHRLRYVVPV